jgi:hypothetical protein
MPPPAPVTTIFMFLSNIFRFLSTCGSARLAAVSRLRVWRRFTPPRLAPSSGSRSAFDRPERRLDLIEAVGVGPVAAEDGSAAQEEDAAVARP